MGSAKKFLFYMNLTRMAQLVQSVMVDICVFFWFLHCHGFVAVEFQKEMTKFVHIAKT